MDELERIASAHESLVELLRAIDASELIRMACESAGIRVRSVTKARERTPKIEVSGLSKTATSYSPDLVYTIHTETGKVIEIWIFEVQLSKDWIKRRRWPLYMVAYAAEYNEDAFLGVFAPEPGLRGWLRDELIPKTIPPPLLINPDQIETITDYSDARRRPELTVLGCVFHAHDPAPIEQQVALVRAAFVAVQTLPIHACQRYTVLVMSIATPSAVEQALEELRESGEIEESRYELFSETERKGHSFHRGLEEGREQGLEQGREQAQRELLRRTILDVLDLRGLAVTPTTQARVESCEAIETLERWYAAAKTAAANQPLDELLVG